MGQSEGEGAARRVSNMDHALTQGLSVESDHIDACGLLRHHQQQRDSQIATQLRWDGDARQEETNQPRGEIAIAGTIFERVLALG